MGTSLIELVLAMMIAGLIIAAAILPMTQAAVAYQETELAVRTATAQAMATVRLSQVAESIWRDDDAPPGLDIVRRARPSELTVGDWSVRQHSGWLEQSLGNRGWARIAGPVSDVTFVYLLSDGSQASSVASSRLDDIVAIRYSWRDAETGRRRVGRIVAPDGQFAGGVIALPQPDLSGTYRRDDFERRVSVSLGSWP
jgi:hypothetical protein